MRNALITGGLGFVGKHFAKNLIEWNTYNKIHIVDKASAYSDIKFFNDFLATKCELHVEDVKHFSLNDLGSISRLDGLDIFHFAAESHVDRSFKNSIDFTVNNTEGTHHLLNALVKVPNHRLIMISTDEVYGEIAGKPVAEDAPFKPTNPYSASKAAADLLCQTYMTCFNLNCKIVRPNNIFGSRQHVEKLIPKTIQFARMGREFPLHGTGLQERSFLHVDDFCEALKKVVATWDETSDRVFNVESFDRRRVCDLVETIYLRHGLSSTLLVECDDRPFNDCAYHVSGEKLRQLGWQQIHSVDSVLEILIKQELFYGLGGRYELKK